MSEKFQNLTDLGGLITDTPEDKIPDRNATDIANIDFSIRGLVQSKKGYDIYGNKISAVGKCLRAFLYKKNFGALKKIKLRVRDDGTNSILEWFNPSSAESDDGDWELFVGGLTKNAIMGFSAFNQSNKNQLIFCNGVENYSQWNGATALVSSVTSNTITKTGTDTFAFEGFETTGSIIIDGTEYAYTGGTATTALTGVTPDPTVQNPSANAGIIQKPDTSSLSAIDKGNIFVVAAARVWMAGVKNQESQLLYSKVADATNFTAGTSPEEAGIEDFPDGGGPITLLDAKDNQKIVIHKEDGILQFRLDYTATAKIPILDVLTLSEDSGATNQKAGAGRNNVSYFTSGIEGLKSLARAIDGESLNLGSISDVILPTIEDYDNSEAAAVYFPKKRVIYVATKSKSSESGNNKVISFYIKKDLIDISIDDAPVADWIVEGGELYFVSSLDQNSYKFFARKSANGAGQNHRWVSKSFTMGQPAMDKEFNVVYVEGLISQGTKIKITILYGQFGTETSTPYTLSWDTDDVVSDRKISALGTEVLGTVSLGASNADIQDSFPFAVPIHIDVNKDTRYKIKVKTFYDSETSDESYWAISNIATNPDLISLDKRNIVNPNS